MRSTFSGLLAQGGSVAIGNSALAFETAKHHHVKIGPFYTAGADYNGSPMYVEAWIKPMTGLSTGYWGVSGFGGKHIILIGGSVGAGRANISGNFANGINGNDINSTDTSPGDGWAHHAMIYVPQDYFGVGTPSTPTAYLYINGFVTGIIPGLVNPRTQGSNLDGGNTFEFGGTDHNGWQGHASQFRIFEGAIPFSSVPNGFMPERSFRGGYYQNGNTRVPVSLCYDFRTNTGFTIPDHGVGFNSGIHTGVLSAGFTSNGLIEEYDNFTTNLPQWVTDPVTKPVETITPATIPPTSILYWGGQHQDITPAFDAYYGGDGTPYLDIGNLDKPSDLAWGTTKIGIINRRLANMDPNSVKVTPDAGVSNQDVFVDCGDVVFAAMPTVYARYTDASNYIRIYRNNSSTVSADEVVGGNVGQTGSWAATGITNLRLVVSGSTASCYAGNVLLGTLTGLTVPLGTKCGFAMSGLQRVAEFAVY